MPERSENRFRTLADAMPQIVWEANAEGLLTYTNQRWTDYSGSNDPSQWFDYVHPSDQARVADQWMSCVAEGKRYESEFRLLRASDKSFRWHLVRAEPGLEAEGAILTWYGTCTDITERKTLEEEKAEAFNALRDAEARLNQALVTSRIGFWDVELPSGKVSLSQQLIDDWDIDASNFDGNLDIPLSRIHPEDRPTVIAAIDKAILTNDPYYVIYRVVFDSKPPMWVEARGQTVKDSDGNVIKFSGTSLDISERIRQQQEIEAKSAEFVALAELTPQLLFTSDAEGSITYYNEPFFEYTGMSFEQLKGWGWKPVIHPDHYDATVARWSYSIKTGEPYETEYMIKRHDGVYRWHLGRAHPVRDSHGAITKWMGTNTDIHEQKEIAAQFKLAKEAAEAANAAKSAFLANMSHEIRTPLGVMMGFAELMRQKDQHADDRVDCAETIIRNGQHLLELINDILDLSKVEAGKLLIELRPVEISEFIKELRRHLQQYAEEKGLLLGINVESTVPPYFETDPTRLRQILINVIGNAIKFTERGAVNVLVRLVEKTIDGTHNLEFLVKDTGCGIAQDQRSHLFEPFVQADSTTSRKFGGTGLGLALSSNLASALGGRLQLLESIAGQGSTFKVTLPIDLNQSERIQNNYVPRHSLEKSLESSPEKEHQTLTGVRVLIVEDTIDNQRMLARFLRRSGASYATASNGEEGISRALSEDFEAVLMDIQMPILDGYESTRMLRANGYKVPIIALTAHAMLDERERCLAAGCDEILTKPIDPVLLVRTIETYAKSKPKVEKEDSDIDILSDILDEFITISLPDIYREMDAAIKIGDAAAIGKNAHKLAGSVAVYKYPKVGEIARILEKETKGMARESIIVSLYSEVRAILAAEPMGGKKQ